MEKKKCFKISTVEEAIEKGFIRHKKAETGSTRAEYGIAGRVDIEKAKQFALESLIKWGGSNPLFFAFFGKIL